MRSYTSRCMPTRRTLSNENTLFEYPSTLPSCWLTDCDRTSKAWTIVELFDMKLILNVGKFRLPFYSKSVTPNILMKSGVESIAECFLYLRICQPNDPYLDSETPSYIENEYKIPSLHLRQRLEIISSDQPPQWSVGSRAFMDST